jgi:hypothetical protein
MAEPSTCASPDAASWRNTIAMTGGFRWRASPRAPACRVGAFYSRYKSKDAFIYVITGDRFRFAKDTAQHELSLDGRRRAPTQKLVREIVGHVVTTMGQPKTAGVTRAAFRLAPKIPHILAPLNEYRETVTQRARAVLVRRLSA